MAGVKILATFGDNKTIKQFENILQERMKWMNETARQSIAATAITALKSIRTKTKVAKKSSIKVTVKPDKSLYPSFTTKGGYKHICVRNEGSGTRYLGPERVVSADRTISSKQHCYRFTDINAKTPKSYIIIATSQSRANQKAKNIITRRAMAYAGLARRAISLLMAKTSTYNDPDPLNPRVENVATNVTTKQEIVTTNNDQSSGNYALVLEDALKYALDAVKGGKATVDDQLKKAMNKTVSVINQKCKRLLGFEKIETPFPEVVKRKK